jgi:hypothetical protein
MVQNNKLFRIDPYSQTVLRTSYDFLTGGVRNGATTNCIMTLSIMTFGITINETDTA